MYRVVEELRMLPERETDRQYVHTRMRLHHANSRRYTSSDG